MKTKTIWKRGCPLRAWFVLMLWGATAGAQVLYVDDSAPADPGPGNAFLSDPEEDGSEDHPFDSVVEAMDWAQDGYTVVVAPGLYLPPLPNAGSRGIHFRGPNIKLRSTDPNDFSVVAQTILGHSITFEVGESADCELAGFKIRGIDFDGIFGNGESGTIRNCLIQGNQTCDGTVLSDFQGLLSNCLIADNKSKLSCGDRPVIFRLGGVMRNCTVTGNRKGIHLKVAPSLLENCIVYGNGVPNVLLDDTTAQASQNSAVKFDVTIAYCNIEGGREHIARMIGSAGTFITDPSSNLLYWEEGNIDETPLFVETGSWETITIEYQNYERYVSGDYHLRTMGWRWSERLTHGSHWLYDNVTSLCIDAGAPALSVGEELMMVAQDPTGEFGTNRGINMGVYGGTRQASLAPPVSDGPLPLLKEEPLWPVFGRSR